MIRGKGGGGFAMTPRFDGARRRAPWIPAPPQERARWPATALGLGILVAAALVAIAIVERCSPGSKRDELRVFSARAHGALVQRAFAEREGRPWNGSVS